MADALSIAASVVGLLAAGAKLASLISQVGSLIDAPTSANATLTELNEISSALRYLQQFLNGLMNVPAGRQQYILVEHLEATLTGCVQTYDKLGDFLNNLGFLPSEMGVLNRFKWVRKEKEVASIIQRLQNHKSSLNLMLTILQCTTSSEIQQSVVKLCDLLEQEISRNDDLSQRLSRVERSHSDNATSRLSSLVQEDDETIRPDPTKDGETMNSGRFGTFTFAFESVLIGSRVYSRANFLQSDSHSETSLTTSHRRNAAFAIFSSQSIAEISNLSVYTLPVSISELSNQSWYISIKSSKSNVVSEREIQVIIKGNSGSAFISISPNRTGRQLKEAFEERRPTWGVDYLTLVLGIQKIDDTKTLREQGVEKEAFLEALPKARWTSGDPGWREQEKIRDLIEQGQPEDSETIRALKKQGKLKDSEKWQRFLGG